MIEFRIKVTTAAKEDSTKKLPDGRLHVSVRAKAKGGRANAAVRETLAGYFRVLPEQVAIVRGHTGPSKTIRVLGDTEER